MPCNHPSSPRTPAFLLLALAAALPAACGSSNGNDAGTDSGGSTDDAGGGADATGNTDTDAGTQDDVIAPGTDSGFTPGPHTPLVQVPDQGGRRLSHVQLVTVTFAGYNHRSEVESFGDWIVGSDWLTTVGEQYGVGTGAHAAKVVVNEQPPATIDDSEIQLWIRSKIADGTLPTPPMPDTNDYLYTVYYPAGTTITETNGQSCVSFGGYHNSIGVGSLNISYAVIPTCTQFDPSLTEIQAITVASSHELIEAATDADPIGGTAWSLSYMGADSSPWVLVGGEVGDLCLGEYAAINNYKVQQVWSNIDAAASQNPCIPAMGETYYSVTADRDALNWVAAGQSIQIPLHGWSSGPMGTWNLYAVAAGGSFTPLVSLDQSTMRNGGTSTLTVRVPAGTASQNYATVYVESYLSTGQVHTYPVGIVVP